MSVEGPSQPNSVSHEPQELETLRTENARLEAALAEAQRWGQWLEAELHHRLRNTLAIVHSVVRRTALTSDSVEDYAMHLEGRVGAIGRGQTLARRGAEARGIDLDALIAEELLAHGAHEGEQLTLAGPPIRLRGAATASLGLAFHELAVNAVKYGALSTPEGRIAVRWHVMGGRLLRLDWVETCPTTAPASPDRRGFGTELIERTLAYELGAESRLTFTGQGLRCTLELPLTDEVSPMEDPA